jgi:hypothetical protein
LGRRVGKHVRYWPEGVDARVEQQRFLSEPAGGTKWLEGIDESEKAIINKTKKTYRDIWNKRQGSKMSQPSDRFSESSRSPPTRSESLWVFPSAAGNSGTG